MSGFRVPLISQVSSRIGQSEIYVQNLRVNTQIVQGPLQALLPLAIPNLGITRTESLFVGYFRA